MTNKIYELAWSVSAELEPTDNHIHFTITTNPSFSRRTVHQFRAMADEMDRILDEQDSKIAEFVSINGAEGTD